MISQKRKFDDDRGHESVPAQKRKKSYDRRRSNKKNSVLHLDSAGLHAPQPESVAAPEGPFRPPTEPSTSLVQPLEGTAAQRKRRKRLRRSLNLKAKKQAEQLHGAVSGSALVAASSAPQSAPTPERESQSEPRRSAVPEALQRVSPTLPLQRASLTIPLNVRKAGTTSLFRPSALNMKETKSSRSAGLAPRSHFGQPFRQKLNSVPTFTSSGDAQTTRERLEGHSNTLGGQTSGESDDDSESESDDEIQSAQPVQGHGSTSESFVALQGVQGETENAPDELAQETPSQEEITFPKMSEDQASHETIKLESAQDIPPRRKLEDGVAHLRSSIRLDVQGAIDHQILGEVDLASQSPEGQVQDDDEAGMFRAKDEVSGTTAAKTRPKRVRVEETTERTTTTRSSVQPFTPQLEAGGTSQGSSSVPARPANGGLKKTPSEDPGGKLSSRGSRKKNELADGDARPESQRSGKDGVSTWDFDEADDSDTLHELIKETTEYVFDFTRQLPASKPSTLLASPRGDHVDALMTNTDSDQGGVRLPESLNESTMHAVDLGDGSENADLPSIEGFAKRNELPRSELGSDTAAGADREDAETYMQPNDTLKLRLSSDSALSELGDTPTPTSDLFESVPVAPLTHAGDETQDLAASGATEKIADKITKTKKRMTGAISRHFPSPKRARRSAASRITEDDSIVVAAPVDPKDDNASETPTQGSANSRRKRPTKKAPAKTAEVEQADLDDDTVPRNKADEGAAVEPKNAPNTPPQQGAPEDEPLELDQPSTAKQTKTPRPKRKSTGKTSDHFSPFGLMKTELKDRVDLTPRRSGRVAGISTALVPSINETKFGLIQERLWDQPFWLIIAVTFLNQTTGRAAVPVFWNVKERYPTPEALAEADVSDLYLMIQRLGLQNQRSKRLVKIARAWVAGPPATGVRFRTLHYPVKGDGKGIKPKQVVGEDAERVEGALEVAGIPGCGSYAWDSWRIFCRDVLRGVAEDYNGKGAADGFEPEWRRVLPLDKELRACLRWMWLREGWIWDPLTGDKRKATDEEMESAVRGEMEIEDATERKFAAQAAAVKDADADADVNSLPKVALDAPDGQHAEDNGDEIGLKALEGSLTSSSKVTNSVQQAAKDTKGLDGAPDSERKAGEDELTRTSGHAAALDVDHDSDTIVVSPWAKRSYTTTTKPNATSSKTSKDRRKSEGSTKAQAKAETKAKNKTTKRKSSIPALTHDEPKPKRRKSATAVLAQEELKPKRRKSATAALTQDESRSKRRRSSRLAEPTALSYIQVTSSNRSVSG